LGQWLLKERLATAMMDLSDGLSSDIARLCGASDVGAKIDSKTVPLPGPRFASSSSRKARLKAALHGGDDYELLFTVARRNLGKIPRRAFGVALTEIGEINASKKIELVDPSGTRIPLRARGWDAFRKQSQRS
jgi:thiamine-monophosphate kinase